MQDISLEESCIEQSAEVGGGLHFTKTPSTTVETALIVLWLLVLDGNRFPFSTQYQCNDHFRFSAWILWSYPPPNAEPVCDSFPGFPDEVAVSLPCTGPESHSDRPPGYGGDSTDVWCS